MQREGGLPAFAQRLHTSDQLLFSGLGTFTSAAICGRNLVFRCPIPPFPKRVLPRTGAPDFGNDERFDREAIETVMYDGEHGRNEAHAAPYALLAGAEGCGTGARSARLAADDKLADFLCRTREELVEEAPEGAGGRMIG